MQDEPKPANRTRKLLILFLKIAVSIACLWYVSGKIDFNKAIAACAEASWIYLFTALLLFIASKIVSAARLNIYFSNIGILLSGWQNTRLYWLGMFYNLFLPGSISGDAYKVILLTRTYKKPFKKITAAVLLDRFSGMAGLALILSAYGFFVLTEDWMILLLIMAAIAGLFILYVITKKNFPDFLPGFTTTLILGIMVQFLQVLAIYMIMLAVDLPIREPAYIFIFLVSSLVSVLPLTIGGLGIRELVFLQGAAYFGLDKESSVIISLIFYLLTLISSLAGMWYMYRDPLKK